MEDFSRYNGEGTTLRKAQQRMLEILTEVDKICRRHSIPYWLEGGTCLGAVRHGGFIPWDDDLDVGVPRKYYKQLCKLLKQELPGSLVFQDASTDKYYPLAFAKVRDKHSIFRDPLLNSKIKEQGIYIDIFPFEKGTESVKRFIDFWYVNIFMRIRHHVKTPWILRQIARLLWHPFRLFLLIVRKIIALLPIKYMIIGFGAPYFYQVKTKDLLPSKPIMFEGYEFFGPVNLDSYLTAHYGNYMKIPDEKNRIVHSNEIIFL